MIEYVLYLIEHNIMPRSTDLYEVLTTSVLHFNDFVQYACLQQNLVGNASCMHLAASHSDRGFGFPN